MRLTPIAILSFALLSACAERTADEIVVGAAASLSALLPELAAAFHEETGIGVVTTVGASGQLAQQIRQGAPIAVLLVADVETVDALAAEGRVLGDSRAVYARGELVLWSRDADAAIHDIHDLASPTIRRIAIANPAFAPYGRAARDALVAAGLWDTVEPRLAIAENVRQALQYAETGNAEVAFAARTLVTGMGGRTVAVPAALYPPLDQALAVVANAVNIDSARRFATFVLHGTGRDILRRHGFGVDGSP